MRGWRSLRLDGSRLFRPADVQLDLGATAKAVAADRTAAAIATALGTGVLVSLGGDIATAGPLPADGWQVTVQDLPSDVPQQVTLHAGRGRRHLEHREAHLAARRAHAPPPRRPRDGRPGNRSVAHRDRGRDRLRAGQHRVDRAIVKGHKAVAGSVAWASRPG